MPDKDAHELLAVGSQKLRYHSIMNSSPLELQRQARKGFLPPECSSCGQSGLMSLWDKMFQQLGMLCAQLLVSEHDFASTQFCETLQATVKDLLDMGVVPVLNENQCSDMTWKEPRTLLDNDGLAAYLAEELNADLALYLTNIDGVPWAPPDREGVQHQPNAPSIISTYCPEIHYDLAHMRSLERPDEVHPASSNVFRMSELEHDDRSARSMRSKIAAAWRCAEAGCAAVILNGLDTNNLWRVIQGEKVGTLFHKHAAMEMAVRGTEIAVGFNPSDPAASGQAGEFARAARSLVAIAEETRAASRQLASLSADARSGILRRLGDGIDEHVDDILKSNHIDVARAQVESHALSKASLQRMVLDEKRIRALAQSMRYIAAMDDPIGAVLTRTEIAEDLILEKQTASIGVLLAIVEGRADVLPQVAALAIRSGNSVLLQGSEEMTLTNATLLGIINAANAPTCSPGVVSLVNGREELDDLLHMHDQIDLIVTRGSAALYEHIREKTCIPVLGHTEGLCHIYIDKDVDMTEACRICVDAKSDYPAACNSVEKILVHRAHRERGGIFQLLSSLRNAGVEVFGSPAVKTLLGVKAPPSLSEEFLDLKVTIDVVTDLSDAVSKIHAFGSAHTDAICTNNSATAEEFLRLVDSACVFANCSTRFSDGWRFGLGGEVGISTGRIHARGPVGAGGLLTTKFVLRGNGQVVDKDQGVNYTHKRLPLN